LIAILIFNFNEYFFFKQLEDLCLFNIYLLNHNNFYLFLFLTWCKSSGAFRIEIWTMRDREFFESFILSFLSNNFSKDQKVNLQKTLAKSGHLWMVEIKGKEFYFSILFTLEEACWSRQRLFWLKRHPSIKFFINVLNSESHFIYNNLITMYNLDNN
jgi:hypothetical protein